MQSVKTVENPYYGVDDNTIGSNSKGAVLYYRDSGSDVSEGEVENVKVVENPYYE